MCVEHASRGYLSTVLTLASQTDDSLAGLQPYDDVAGALTAALAVLTFGNTALFVKELADLMAMHALGLPKVLHFAQRTHEPLASVSIV